LRGPVKFKLFVGLPVSARHGTTVYIADDLYLISADGNRRHLRSADSPTLVVRPTRRSASVRFPWQLHVYGTVFHQPSEMCHHFCHSGAAWRHGFLNWRLCTLTLLAPLRFCFVFTQIT